MNSKHLAGKAAFVTGGARGIGAAIVRRLAADGASVAFSYASNEAAAKELASSIEADGGRVIPMRVDSADEKALR